MAIYLLFTVFYVFRLTKQNQNGTLKYKSLRERMLLDVSENYRKIMQIEKGQPTVCKRSFMQITLTMNVGRAVAESQPYSVVSFWPW